VTREHKLALIVGFSLVLVVGILISDHLSPAALDEPLETLSFSLPLADPEPFVVPSIRHASPAGHTEPGVDPSADRSTPKEPGPAESPRTGPGHRGSAGPIEIIQGVEPVSRQEQRPEPPVRNEPPPFIPPDQAVASTAPRYAKYIVQEGDTLAGIARRHLHDADRWPELQALNADRVRPDGSVRAGVTLRIPILSSDVPLNARSARPDSAREAKRRVYVVKPNDTLSQIAQRELGTVKRMQEILELNKDKIDNADEIYEGLELILPSR